ncbi:MAG: LysR substrate-binding domain-containing protein [Dongiaceae bacterium]
MSQLRRLLPSANALLVFEAAARLLSFTKAAAELSVTQSAVSRMISRFESHIGLALFLRNPTGLTLTDDGRHLFNAVASSLQRVELTLEDLLARKSGKSTVTMSVSSAFAMHWFMPRMEDFQDRFPTIDLRFQLVRSEPVGPVLDVDFGVRYDTPDDGNHLRWPLMEEEVLPVCNPAYLESHGGLDECRDLGGHTLVHLSGSVRIPWSRYLAEFGYPPVTGSRSLTFSDYTLVIQAGVSGRGIALGWWHVIARDLISRNLAPASRNVLRTGRSYYIAATASRPLREPAAQVRDWLLAEMQRERKTILAGGT